KFGLIFNLFFCVGFFAIYGVSFAVLRRLGILPVLAAAGALVFSLLPFHFWRLWHLFLATYFVIPIIVWLCLRIWSLQDQGSGNNGKSLSENKAAIGLAARTAGCGIYYAFFSAM